MSGSQGSGPCARHGSHPLTLSGLFPLLPCLLLPASPLRLGLLGLLAAETGLDPPGQQAGAALAVVLAQLPLVLGIFGGPFPVAAELGCRCHGQSRHGEERGAIPHARLNCFWKLARSSASVIGAGGFPLVDGSLPSEGPLAAGPGALELNRDAHHIGAASAATHAGALSALVGKKDTMREMRCISSENRPAWPGFSLIAPIQLLPEEAVSSKNRQAKVNRRQYSAASLRITAADPRGSTAARSFCPARRAVFLDDARLALINIVVS